MLAFLTDLRFAGRMLTRRPAFAALVICTLALGIGATTAIFSVVNPILLDPLPYPGPDRLVMVWESERDGSRSNVGFATFADIRAESKSLASVAAISLWQPTLTGRAEPERLTGQRVSAPYFHTLGLVPMIGRDFTSDDDNPAAPRVTILGNAIWRSRFGGDTTILGQQITLSDIAVTVIGVLPPAFDNVLEPTAQLFSPLRYDVSLPYACRTCRHLRMVGRLRPDVTIAAAERELHALAINLLRDHPTDYASAGLIAQPLAEEVTGGVRPVVIALLGAVLLMLLIAASNVTNLLLARGAQRRREISIRVALGAGRARVARQLLTESLLLAACGGALGVAVAWAGARLLVSMAPPGMPRLDAVEVNGPVLFFCIGITALVGLSFGTVPALHASRTDLHSGMRLGSARSGHGSGRTRGALVVGEVAIALLLLVGTGLLVRSMRQLLSISPGFEPSHLLTMQVQTNGKRFAADSNTYQFFSSALDAVRRTPGVESAGFTSELPLSGDFDGYGVHNLTHPNANPELDPSAHRHAVSASYLSTMKIPVLRGRGFTDQDRAGQPGVALVNAHFAAAAFHGENPIGQRVRLGDPNAGLEREIVGIVGDVKHLSLSGDQVDEIYLPNEQWNAADGALSFVIRTHGNPDALVSALRSAIWSVDKDQPITRIVTMDNLLAASVAQRRFAMVLFELFAAVAVVLAAAGIYGVLAGMVTERRRELGVRAALGASRRELLAMVVRRGLRLAAIGVVIGVVAALAFGRVLSGLLFGVSPLDPVTYLVMAASMLIIAALASWVPAWRAARVDPALVMRTE